MATAVVTITIWLMVAKAQAYSVTYSDCRKATDMVTLDRQSLCGQAPASRTPPQVFDLLQIREVTVLEGYSCHATRSTFKFFCGSFSHMKVLDLPRLNVPLSLSPEICRKMVQDQQFKGPERP